LLLSRKGEHVTDEWTCRTGYNFTGSHEAIYNQFVAPEQEFDVTPTAVTIVE
jgi:hypothetical protein